MFFVNKISNLKLGITPSCFDPSLLPVCSATFSHFKPISGTHLQKIVNQLKPSGSSIDIIPTYFLKHVYDVVGPQLLIMINRCSETGIVPDLLKRATVHPLLKKTELKPISNSSFIAKIWRKLSYSNCRVF